MALIEASRIRLRPTPVEHVALRVAAWISSIVAGRMERRARRASETVLAQGLIDDVTARRDGERARAYLLGLR